MLAGGDDDLDETEEMFAAAAEGNDEEDFEQFEKFELVKTKNSIQRSNTNEPLK